MPLANHQHLLDELKKSGNPVKSKNSAWFFKTGQGQYGEADIFIGVTMPEQRKLIKQYLHLSLKEVKQLLHSPEHECRMCALLILVAQYKKGTEKERENIYTLYLQNTKWINNWDLVDASAEHITGPWLEDKKEKMKVLSNLAKSKSLWERRIAMLSTFNYIKKGNAKESLQIAKILLKDEHDLIHKAVGWMLREVGKRCSVLEEEIFLKQHYNNMPRTMLRYAIEHFPEEKRKAYLSGIIV